MRRRSLAILPVLVVLTAAGCAVALGGASDDTAASSTPVALVSGQKAVDHVGSFRFRGAVTFAAPHVGGLSGLAVLDGNRQLVAISDRAQIVTARLRLDGQGGLAAVESPVLRPLPLERRPKAGERLSDSEELAALPDGGWLVSFERAHRILRYGPGFAHPVMLPTPPGAEDAPSNGGMEALTVLPDGRLLAFEEGEDGPQPRPAWLGTPPVRGDGDWAVMSYRPAAGFRPTGAATLPDGDALVLERRVSWIGGWGSRIVRLPAASLRAGADLSGVELARLESPFITENFEGIAVTRGPAGETLVWLISDDNFSPLQRTLLVLLELPVAMPVAKPVVERR